MKVGFPDPKMIEANGIRMEIFEQGEGFPIVLAHGFPELAYSWRFQIPALANAGYRAIAPNQRGYGETDKPDAVEAYDMRQLCGDMAGLLDALNLERAVFVDHDWGAPVVPEYHPQLAFVCRSSPADRCVLRDGVRGLRYRAEGR